MQEKVNLRVDWATHEASKYACNNWHYSESIPKSKLVKCGVWEDEKFIGVVIFSYGANALLMSPYNLTMDKGCELTRIALTKHKSSVSQIMSLAIKKLKIFCPKLELIVSYADLDQNHLGIIYQATNWIYEGTTMENKHSAYIIKGKKIHNKTVGDFVNKRGKICNKENIKLLYKTNDVKKFYSKGKHKYLMPLTKYRRKQIKHLSKVYPKANKLGDG